MISIKRMMLFMLCINLGCWMVATLFPSYALYKPVIPISYGSIEAWIRSTASADPTGFVTLLVGYVWLAFTTIVNIFGWVLFGFPALLINLGVPEVIKYPVLTLWAACFVYGVIEFLGGRHA